MLQQQGMYQQPFLPPQFAPTASVAPPGMVNITTEQLQKLTDLSKWALQKQKEEEMEQPMSTGSRSPVEAVSINYSRASTPLIPLHQPSEEEDYPPNQDARDSDEVEIEDPAEHQGSGEPS